MSQCWNNTKCTQIWVNSRIACKRINTWNSNSTRPTCTDECMKWIDRLDNNAITEHIKCCECDDGTYNKTCGILKTNIEKSCGTRFGSSEQCQYYKSACEHEKAKEVAIDREGKHQIVLQCKYGFSIGPCPPKMCKDRCRSNQKCMKYYNDVQFFCRNVLEWKDEQNQPVCSVDCQKAIDRLSTVSQHTVGFDALCCICGDYSDLFDNDFPNIRSWERCRRENSNIAQFCNHNCTDCSKINSLSKQFKSALYCIIMPMSRFRAPAKAVL